MIVERIRLCDLKSYKDLTLELRPGINVIAGPNGAGKSTVVEAIGIALFDAWPPWANDRQRQMVRRGAKTATIDVTVSHGGERFRVERVLGVHKARWTVFDAAGHALTSGQIGETGEWLRRRLGSRDVAMDKLFSDIVGTYQGHFTTPFEATPADRTKVFEKILQVDGWKAMAVGLGERARASLEEKRHAALRELEGLTQMIADRGPEADEAATREAAAAAADEQLARAQGELGRAEEVGAQAARAEEDLRTAAEGLRSAGEAVVRERLAVERAQLALGEARAAADERDRTRPGAQAYARAEAARKVGERDRAERDRIERERAQAASELAAQRSRAEELTAAACARDSRLQGEEATAGRQRGEAEAAFAQADAAATAQRTALEHQRSQVLAPAQVEAEAAREAAREVEALAALLGDTRATGMALATGALAKLRRHDEIAALAATRATAEAAVDQARAEIATLEAQIADKQALAQRAQGGRCPLLDERCPHPRGLDLAASVTADGGALAQAAAALRARLGGELEPAFAERLDAERRLEGLKELTVAASKEVARMRLALDAHVRRARALAAPGSAAGKAVGPARVRSPMADDVREAGFVEALERALVQAATRQREVEVSVRLRLEAAAVAEAAARDSAGALERQSGVLQEAAGAARGRVAEARRQVERAASDRREHVGEVERARLATAAAAQADETVVRATGALARFVGLDERLAALAGELEARQGEHLQHERAGAIAAALPDRELAAREAARRLAADEARVTQASAVAAALLGGAVAGGPALLAACVSARAVRRAEVEAAQRRTANLRLCVAALAQVATVAAERLKAARDAQVKIVAWRRELARIEARKGRLEETLRVAKGIADQVLKRAGARIAERQVERVAAQAADLYRRIAPHDNLQLGWSPVDYGIELRGRIDDNQETLVFHQLSGGQKMTAALAVRLALVRAFAGRLGFVCLDEPTTHLDPERRGELAEALGRLRAEGGTWFEQLFLVSHDNAFEALDECHITLSLDPISKATRVAERPDGSAGKQVGPAVHEAGPVRRKRPAVGR